MIEEYPKDFLAGQLFLGSLFLLLFIIITYFFYLRNFFSLKAATCKAVNIYGKDVFYNLILFFGAFIITSNIGFLILLHYDLLNNVTITILPAISFAFYLGLLTCFSLSRSQFCIKKIIKDKKFSYSLSLPQDILCGLKGFLLSIFPVLFAMTLFSILFFLLGHKIPPHQDAVAFLIATKNNPISLFFALFSIIIIAPLIEEFLFRGIIQNYLRTKVNYKKAIIYTSILFSLFHFSFGQKWQNLPIIASLFILSLYLGFLYEKTRSLISNITLHVTFNLISAIKIIFYTS